MRWWTILAVGFLAGFLTPVLPPVAGAQVAVDLSEHLVAIATDFSGTDILLFGATEGEGDVVVVVRGPIHRQVVRRKAQVAGIWVNRDEMMFDYVPSFYAIAGSQPIDRFALRAVREAERIGIEFVPMKGPEDANAVEVAEFRKALVRNKQRAHLYSEEPGRVLFIGNQLFRTTIHLPANAPVGAYQARVYVFRDGTIHGMTTTPLVITKVGFEARVFNFAHRHSLAYGVLAIFLAGMAGWIANALFRKA